MQLIIALIALSIQSTYGNSIRSLKSVEPVTDLFLHSLREEMLLLKKIASTFDSSEKSILPATATSIGDTLSNIVEPEVSVNNTLVIEKVGMMFYSSSKKLTELSIFKIRVQMVRRVMPNGRVVYVPVDHNKNHYFIGK